MAVTFGPKGRVTVVTSTGFDNCQQLEHPKNPYSSYGPVQTGQHSPALALTFRSLDASARPAADLEGRPARWKILPASSTEFIVSEHNT